MSKAVAGKGAFEFVSGEAPFHDAMINDGEDCIACDEKGVLCLAIEYKGRVYYGNTIVEAERLMECLECGAVYLDDEDFVSDLEIEAAMKRKRVAWAGDE